MDGTIFDGEQKLAHGSFTLSTGNPVVSGSIVIGNVGDLLLFRHLTLRPATGPELEIVPRRIERSANGPATLIFDVDA